MLFCLPLGPTKCALHFSWVGTDSHYLWKNFLFHVKQCNLIPGLKNSLREERSGGSDAGSQDVSHK